MNFLRRLLGHEADQTNNTPEFMRDEAESIAEIAPAWTGASSAKEDAGQDQSNTPELVQEAPSVLTTPIDGKAVEQLKGLRVGYASDVGCSRDHNEDTLITFQGIQLGDDSSDPFGFFVVADGMGGHRAGEVASSLAARMVSCDVLQKVYLPYLLKETPSANMAPLTEVLRAAVQKANDLVHQQVPGGGTTLTCALILGQRAYVAHVGDSRAYLLTNYDIRQVTQDHSYVGRLIELGELSPEEAAIHPQRHVLYRAIGQGENLDIDTYHQFLPPGSRLLLCSDGLSGVVSEKQISRIIVAANTPQEACDHLLATANEAGGPDNITAVLIETPPD
jgi:serine/threonine protein phosphatase PrpC